MARLILVSIFVGESIRIQGFKRMVTSITMRERPFLNGLVPLQIFEEISSELTANHFQYVTANDSHW